MSIFQVSLSRHCTQIVEDIERIQSELQTLGVDSIEGMSPFDGVHNRSREVLRLAWKRNCARLEACHLARQVLKLKQAFSQKDDLFSYISNIKSLSEKILRLDANLKSPARDEHKSRMENTRAEELEDTDECFKELINDGYRIIARKLRAFLLPAVVKNLPKHFDSPFLEVREIKVNLDPLIVEVIPKLKAAVQDIRDLGKKDHPIGSKHVLKMEMTIEAIEQAKEGAIPSFLSAILRFLNPHSKEVYENPEAQIRGIEKTMTERPQLESVRPAWNKLESIRSSWSTRIIDPLEEYCEAFFQLNKALIEAISMDKPEPKEENKMNGAVEDPVVEVLLLLSPEGQKNLIRRNTDKWGTEVYRVFIAKELPAPTLLAMLDKAIRDENVEAQFLFLNEQILSTLHLNHKNELTTLLTFANAAVQALYHESMRIRASTDKWGIDMYEEYLLKRLPASILLAVFDKAIRDENVEAQRLFLDESALEILHTKYQKDFELLLSRTNADVQNEYATKLKESRR